MGPTNISNVNFLKSLLKCRSPDWGTDSGMSIIIVVDGSSIIARSKSLFECDPKRARLGGLSRERRRAASRVAAAADDL